MVHLSNLLGFALRALIANPSMVPYIGIDEMSIVVTTSARLMSSVIATLPAENCRSTEICAGAMESASHKAETKEVIIVAARNMIIAFIVLISLLNDD